MDEHDKRLSPEQFEEFCRARGLERSRASFRGNGAHRDAVLADGQVFLFPRARRYHDSMCRELEFLRQAIGRVGNLPVPRFLDLIECPTAYSAPIGVVSFLEGENWEDIQESFSWEFIQAVWDELVELLIVCHGLPISLGPSSSGPALSFSEIPRMQAWLAGSLDDLTSAQAVANLHAEIVAAAVELGVEAGAVGGENTLVAWTQVVGQLAALPPALLHGDMHEGQILLKPDRRPAITGVLDWEAVQMGNPLMDFSLHKWGWGRIWAFSGQFASWRRRLWGRYLAGRGITGLSPDSLHLYCSLTEMHRTLLERREARRPAATVTRKPYRESMGEQLETLRVATAAVRL